MNARLIELANQAAARTLVKLPSDDFTQMFADLIIKECLEQCQNVGAVIEAMHEGEQARRYKAITDSCQKMIEVRLLWS